jgi:hypothetical protein
VGQGLELFGSNEAFAEGHFFDAQDVAVVVKGHNAVAVGVCDLVSEDDATFLQVGALLQDRVKPVAVKNVVPQDQTHGIRADELFAQDECLGQAIGPGVGSDQLNPDAAGALQHLLDLHGQVELAVACDAFSLYSSGD